MGWRFQWVSSFGSEFKFDYNVSYTPEEKASGKIYYTYDTSEYFSEEGPGASVFARDVHAEVFHTYSSYARGLDILVGTYNFLDLVPKGRDEDGLALTMAWVRHHDRYAEGYFIDPEQKFVEPKKAAGVCCSGKGHSYKRTGTSSSA